MAALIAGSMITLNAQQLDPREPGLYAVNGEESTLLTFTDASQSSSGISIGIISLGKRQLEFKGATSGTEAHGKFVLVINHEQKSATRVLKNYKPFIKTMNPDDLMIIPLTVEKKKRVLDEGLFVNGFGTKLIHGVPFSWVQIADNAFEIEVPNLIPGEYGVALKFAELDTFDIKTLYGFYVTEE